jgi:hypothetical protein
MSVVSLFKCHNTGSSMRNLAARYNSDLLMESKLKHCHRKLLRYESVLGYVDEPLRSISTTIHFSTVLVSHFRPDFCS